MDRFPPFKSIFAPRNHGYFRSFDTLIYRQYNLFFLYQFCDTNNFAKLKITVVVLVFKGGFVHNKKCPQNEDRNEVHVYLYGSARLFGGQFRLAFEKKSVIFWCHQQQLRGVTTSVVKKNSISIIQSSHSIA